MNSYQKQKAKIAELEGAKEGYLRDIRTIVNNPNGVIANQYRHMFDLQAGLEHAVFFSERPNAEFFEGLDFDTDNTNVKETNRHVSKLKDLI